LNGFAFVVYGSLLGLSKFFKGNSFGIDKCGNRKMFEPFGEFGFGNAFCFVIMKGVSHLVFIEPDEGFFHGVAVFNAVNNHGSKISGC
jgi:hypothetical protein